MRTGSDGEQPFVVLVNGEFLQGLMIASFNCESIWLCTYGRIDSFEHNCSTGTSTSKLYSQINGIMVISNPIIWWEKF